MADRRKVSDGTIVRGTYAVREKQGALRRIRTDLNRLARSLLPGFPDSAQYPYTEAGKPPRPDRAVVGACPICFNSCPVTYHLAGDRLTGVTGVESDPVTRGRLCPKGQFQIQMYNSPDRLVKPLKRVGSAGRGPV